MNLFKAIGKAFGAPDYNFSTVEGINAIPVPKRKETKPHDVKSGLEYQLQRLATKYKNEGKMDLAIACLRKSNEVMPYSIFAYSRKDYQRLVEFLKDDGQFDEAKRVSKRLDELYGTEIQCLEKMMSYEKGKAAKEAYYKRIIVPKKQELQDRDEYDWIRENLKDKVPLSFGGYRKMKNSLSPNFLKLVDIAKEKGYIIKY